MQTMVTMLKVSAPLDVDTFESAGEAVKILRQASAEIAKNLPKGSKIAVELTQSVETPKAERKPRKPRAAKTTASAAEALPEPVQEDVGVAQGSDMPSWQRSAQTLREGPGWTKKTAG